jgi:hypothetical protein
MVKGSGAASRLNTVVAVLCPLRRLRVLLVREGALRTMAFGGIVARTGLRLVVVASALASAACAATAPATKTAPSSTAVDACLVGTWREVTYQQLLDLTGAGGAKALVKGAGRTLTFRADGTELIDYGTGVTYRGTSDDGVAVEAVITGNAQSEVSTANGQMTFKVLVDKVQIEYRSDGRVLGTSTAGLSPPVSYTCSGGTMTQSLDDYQYHAEYRRA